MALGGSVLRQHVVEFIRGTGLVTDGVTNATSTNGPWTWTVPEGVAEINLDGIGGGGGGGGGCSTTNARAGGGAGGSGAWLASTRMQVRPSSSLTITLGAGGAGGAVDTLGADGGPTTVAGLTNVQWTGYNASYVAGKLVLPQGQGGNAATTSSGGNPGVCGGIYSAGTSYAGGAFGTANAASPAVPGTGSQLGNELTNTIFCAAYSLGGYPGSGGGGASTTGSVAGAAGGGGVGFGRSLFGFSYNDNISTAGGTNGTTSFGGGGVGAPSAYGYPGAGGGNATGTSQAGGNASGYGAGGGGGGGSGAGGNGAPGYVRFTYWSAD